jgi:pSer/pThr/pTyr-binding forkhead associated (FHA) protein
MLNLKLSSKTDGQTLDFLSQNPSISQSLLAEAGHDIGRVSTIIRPVLEAPSRCEISSYYIQAVTTGRTAFLTTNLSDHQTAQVTEAASGWLIGRSPNCAIAVEDPSISRCHAVIGHRPNQGFYIIDVGSSNGTFVNGSRLIAMEQCLLNDGDIIKLSNTCVEFFVSGWRNPAEGCDETQV